MSSRLLTPGEMAIALASRFLGAEENKPIRARAWINEHKREVTILLKAQREITLKEVEKKLAPHYVQGLDGRYYQEGWFLPDEIWEALKRGR